MGARYKFNFDGVAFGEPTNWDTLSTTLKRDENTRGILITQDAQLEFTGSEHEYLYDKFLNDGFCSYTEVEIFESCNMNDVYESVYKGTIFTSDCEFLIDKCIARTKVQDNSFFAKINGRKSNEAYINVGRSINDVAITECSPVAITMFSPCSPATEDDRKGYRVFDVMQFLVAYMTDGEMEFASPVLDDGGDFEGLCIASGKQLRDIAELTYINKFSFAKAFENLWKKLNLSFYIDYSGSKPTLIVDYTDNLYSDTQVLELNDVPAIKVKVDVSKIFSAVHFGTSETLEADTQCDDLDGDGLTNGAFVDQISFAGCKDETFNVLGKCNIDRTLDLSTDWIVSSNVIQYIYIDAGPGGEDDDSYDDDIIFIDCEKTGSTTYAAYKTNNLGGDVTVRAFYNVRLFNFNVAERFFGSIPFPIAEYLGTVDDLFKAKKRSFNDYASATFLAPLVSNEPVHFDNDFTSPYNDVNNHYGNGTVQGNTVSQANSRFTAYASGMYHFRVFIERIVSGLAGANVTVAVKRYDAGNTLLSFVNETLITALGLNASNEFLMEPMYMDATDYCQVDIGYPNTVGIDDLDGYLEFECVKNPGGGIYHTYDPADYPIINYSFQYPLSNEDKKTIKETPFGKIRVNSGGKTYYGWIQEIKINDTTGMTDFKLITKANAGN